MIYKTGILIKGFDELITSAIFEWLEAQNNFNIATDLDNITHNQDEDFNIDLCIEFYNGTNQIDSSNEIPKVIIYKGALPNNYNKDSNNITLALPFRFAELEAGIYTLLRTKETNNMAALKLNNYEFCPMRRAFVIDDKEVLKLTDKEIEILTYLNNAGGKVSRDELLREVWRYNEGVTTHTLETHIYRLRQKLTNALGKADLLVTEEGGYSLNKD